MFMSIVDGRWHGSVAPLVAAVWKPGPPTGADQAAGRAMPVSNPPFDGLGFLVTNTQLFGEGVLGTETVVLPEGGWALRVDEVAFPVGAIAHRHTHTGSGWRHLVEGQLRLETEHGIETMMPGTSWFEPAGSPVRAVAEQSEGITRFVRAMVIPQADMGQSTFRLYDAADAQLPRLQVTHRHLDIPVQVDAG